MKKPARASLSGVAAYDESSGLCSTSDKAYAISFATYHALKEARRASSCLYWLYIPVTTPQLGALLQCSDLVLWLCFHHSPQFSNLPGIVVDAPVNQHQAAAEAHHPIVVGRGRLEVEAALGELHWGSKKAAMEGMWPAVYRVGEQSLLFSVHLINTDVQ